MTQEMRFPEGFAWGASTSAYQIEGAVHEGGRGESIWDAYAHIPGKMVNGDTGDVACDHYHRYKHDVQLMKEIGLTHYRFSIAWPRILPAGTGDVNEQGIQFYSDLIDELLANGIEPFPVLFHWDLPMRLQLEYDGWLSGEVIQEAFVQYARVCFERFGDRVKQWLTINEPWIFAVVGYAWAEMAPGREHNAHTEPYIVGHNLLLAHAKAVDLYRREFQPTQNGTIGITLAVEWSEPAPSDDPQAFKRNEEAAERELLFQAGWFADPIYKGDYPDIMKERVGNRLPQFTDEERKLVLGSSDFFGLNHYATRYKAPTGAFLSGAAPDGNGSFDDDCGTVTSVDDAWERTDVRWPVVPQGFGNLLLWLERRYQPKGGIIVTENGCAWAGTTKDEAINDVFRVKFHAQYIAAMHAAIQHGADVRGYFAWSLLDNLEWSQGFGKRFGLVYVDYATQERTLKKSAIAYRSIIKKNAIIVE